MPDILQRLLQEPIILLILATWIISMLGNVMQKAARRAQQQRAEQRRAPDPRQVGGGTTASRRPDPDDIAREIRRAMGLERDRPASRPPPVPEEAGTGAGGARAPRSAGHVEQAPERRASFDERRQRPTIVVDDARPRRTLRQELAERDAKAAADLARQGVADRILITQIGMPGSTIREIGGARRRGRGLLDLSRPAAAIVAMEVLGKPIALRDRPIGADW